MSSQKLRLYRQPLASLCRLATFFAFALIAVKIAAATESVGHSASVQTASFVSRELLDLEYQSDRSLSILVSTPGAAAPGLYRWRPGDAQPIRLCEIVSPSFFSFDRRFVIERERGAKSRIRIYSPIDCLLLTTIEIPGRVLDVDVRAGLLAAAVRLPEREIALQLYRFNGTLLSSASIGRNVEMGFSPDGRMIVNFDLSDVGLQAWRVPQLSNVLFPSWLYEGDVTFVPGARFVKRYIDERLSIMRWPTGAVVHEIKASRAIRLRALSADARYGVGHELVSNEELLQWIDFKRDERVVLARGTIDNAAISRDVSHAAWSLRLSGKEHRVLVQRRAVSAHASLSTNPPTASPINIYSPTLTDLLAPKAAASAPMSQ